MTRQLSVVEQFEQGTLLKVTPHPEYADVGTIHGYYVPHRARQDAGMEKVQEMESADAFRDEDGSFDWTAIRDLVSAEDIVERVEENTLNHTDGAVGNTTKRRPGLTWSELASSDESGIPTGVVKFGDPDVEDGPLRDPIERGYCWATLQDWMPPDSVNRRVKYRDDVQKGHVLRARVPMCVVRTRNDAVSAYLAAHDHSDRHIASALDAESEMVRDILGEILDNWRGRSCDHRQ